jgi:hypothetical protein
MLYLDACQLTGQGFALRLLPFMGGHDRLLGRAVLSLLVVLKIRLGLVEQPQLCIRDPLA